MIKSTFADALRKGLGRAVLHARLGLGHADLAELRRWYIDTPAFDPQIEDGRADHIFRVAQAAGDLSALQTTVLTSLNQIAEVAEREAPTHQSSAQQVSSARMHHQLDLADFIASRIDDSICPQDRTSTSTSSTANNPEAQRDHALNEPPAQSRGTADQPTSSIHSDRSDLNSPSAQAARRAIERTLAAFLPHGRIFGAFNLVELDRIPGLLRVARILGGDIPPDDRWRVDSLIRCAVGADAYATEDTKTPALVALRDAARIDQRIAAFLALRRSPDEPPAPAKDTWPTFQADAPFDALLGYLHGLPPEASQHTRRMAAKGWARQASESELRRAAESLDTLEDKPNFYALAAIWHRDRPLPIVSDAMLRRAQDARDPFHSRAQWLLGTTADPRVRNLALSLITSDAIGRDTLDMLEGALLIEDGPLLAPHIFRCNETPDSRDDETLHGIGIGALKLAEKAATQLEKNTDASTLAGSGENKVRSAWMSIARWVYEVTPCSFCRGRVMDILADHDDAADLAREAIHDADERARDKSAEILSAQRP